MDNRRRTLGVPHPRRTLDWLACTRKAAIVTVVISFAGLLFTASEAAVPGASEAPLRLTDIIILLSIGGQTAAIAFFAGGLAARVTSIERWREEHIQWADRQVERLEKADETLRSRPPGAH